MCLGNPEGFTDPVPPGFRYSFLKGTADMSTTSSKPVKFIAWFTMVAGILMIVAGGVTWGLVQSQLTDENIKVAAVTPENPGRLAGKDVAGPFTAYAQAAAIDYHAREGAGGKTYAELGDDLRALKDKLKTSGATDADLATNADVMKLTATRTSTMNGSFLRASLFTSVVAFGIAALVMGLGLLFVLIGLALTKVSNTVVVNETSAHTAGAAPRKA